MNSARFTELYNSLDFCTDGMDGVKIKMDSGDVCSAASELVRHFKTRTKPCYFYDAMHREKQTEIVKRDKFLFDRIISDADRIMGYRPEMFGMKVDFDNPDVWNFIKYKASSTYGGLINRFEWLIPVGQAYWITNDNKYADFFLKIINGWIEKNPLLDKVAHIRGQGTEGLPWNNTLDIGFRLKNFVALFSYFRTYSGWNDDDYIDFLYVILKHGQFLYPQQGNLFGGNWQTQECEGLAHAGIMFPEFKGASDWYDVAELRFTQHSSEPLTQPDGTYREPTPGYFGAVRGNLFSFVALSELNGYRINSLLKSSIEKMYDWFMNMTMQDGYMPMVGDTTLSDQRKDLALGAALFKRGDLKYVSNCEVLPTEFIWIVSKELFDEFEKIESKKPSDSQSCLENCQYTILRDDWENYGHGNSIFFDVNRVSFGHNHFDYLNVEAVFNGERLITESGHLGYRNAFRLKYVVAPIGHNILMIDDGARQSEWLSEDIPTITAKYFSKSFDYIEGRVIYPPKGEEPEIEWRRAIIYLKPDLFLISDFVKGSGNHMIKRLFHTGVETQNEILKNSNSVRIIGKSSSVYIMTAFEDGMCLTGEDGLENFEGKLKVCIFQQNADLPVRTLTVIAKDNCNSAPTVTKTTENSFEVLYGKEKFEVQFADNGESTSIDVHKA